MTDKEANEIIEEGKKLYHEGNYEDAIECFEKISEDNKMDYYYVMHWKGYCLYYLEKYEDAIKDFELVLGKTIYDSHANNWIGRCLHALKKHKEAIISYSKIPKEDTNYLSSQYNIGLSYCELEDNKIAAQHFIKSKRVVFTILISFNGTKLAKDIASHMLNLNDEDFFNKTLAKASIDKASKEYQEYKEIYINSLLIIAKLHVTSEHEQFVAHYTQKHIAEKMLFDDSAFRLHTTITGNDPKEGKTLLDFLEIDKHIAEHSCERNDTGNDYQAFVGCFTFNFDSLNQFRLYGKDNNQEATGVSIVVNQKFFNEQASLNVEEIYKSPIAKEKSMGKDDEKDKKEDVKKRHALYRCIYLDPNTQKVISLGQREEYAFYRQDKNIDKDIITKYKAELEDTKEEVQKLLKDLSQLIKDGENLKNDIVCELLLSLRYLTKHVAFKEEQECRILDIEKLSDNNDVKCKDNKCPQRDYRTLYIEYLQLSDEYVKEVHFAPKAGGYELFRDIAKHKGRRFVCRQCDHPFF